MAQFPGKLDIIGNVSFLNNTLLVNNGVPQRATAMLRARGCSGKHFAMVTGQPGMIATTPVIEMTDAQCTGVAVAFGVTTVGAGGPARKSPKKKVVDKPSVAGRTA